MTRYGVDRSRACLYVVGVREQSERQESFGRAASHAMDAKRLQYGRGLLSQDAVTGRTGEAGLPA